MSYHGSEIDREIARIVKFWRGQVVQAYIWGEVSKKPSFPFEPWPTSWPYWTRMYESTAKRLWDKGDMHAADDIATLVMGLVEYEREEARASV